MARMSDEEFAEKYLELTFARDGIEREMELVKQEYINEWDDDEAAKIWEEYEKLSYELAKAKRAIKEFFENL
jgi:hypothetical protein